MRKYILLRDKGFCYFCHRLIKSRPTVHHIKELDENNWTDPDIALNPENLVACHAECHNLYHERFGYKPSMVNLDLSVDYTRRKV